MRLLQEHHCFEKRNKAAQPAFFGPISAQFAIYPEGQCMQIILQMVHKTETLDANSHRFAQR